MGRHKIIIFSEEINFVGENYIYGCMFLLKKGLFLSQKFGPKKNVIEFLGITFGDESINFDDEIINFIGKKFSINYFK